MRCSSSLLVASALSLTASAINLPFSFEWLVSGAKDASLGALTAEVVPHKIAVIGAGAGGSSTAFWIQKAKSRAGVNVEVDVYERSGYVGGRSTVVFPFNDTSLIPVELGASIFVEVNKNLWRATDEFQLDRVNFDDEDETIGFWDGEQFLFVMESAPGPFGWWNTVKALWRYGFQAPNRTKKIVNDIVSRFLSVYDEDGPRWASLEQLSESLNFTKLIAQSTAEHLDLEGVGRRWSREVVESFTRVNYGQNVDQIHMLEGACSLAASGASSVKGGNFQIFENFIARSGANVHLNTTVESITETRSGGWSLDFVGDTHGSKVYDDVIIAAPFHQTGIKIKPSSWSFSKTELDPIPAQPYVHLHVTLLATTAEHPNPEYFGLKRGSNVPKMILTSNEGVRRGGKGPEFNSLTYHGPAGVGRENEFVVKIFSAEKIEDDWLDNVFDGKVGWVVRKEWDAYPELPPTSHFPPVVVAKGLYYVNSFEPFISTMETETVSSQNIVEMLFRERFGTDICGVNVRVAVIPPTSAPEETVVDQVVLGEGVLEATIEHPKTTQKNPEDPKLKAKNTNEKFVRGWDC